MPKNLSDLSDKLTALPSLSELSCEDEFAEVWVAWSKKGLGFVFDVQEPVHQCRYPDLTRGDSVEIFLDTRAVKTAGYNTRHCHHFFFLPEEVGGVDRGEITRFRTEDAHELCEPSSLELSVRKTTKGYVMQIFICSESLHGYDSGSIDRLGFSYRINRCTGKAQHFGAHSDEFQIEQQPSLWTNLKLVP